MAGWTDERVEELKMLWDRGLSASECAKALGGLSRNAVIGKVNRLKLPARVFRTTGKAVRTANMTRPDRKRPAHNAVNAMERALGLFPPRENHRPPGKPEPSAPRATVPVLQTPIQERKMFDDLEPDECLFPFGEGPYQFCARKKVHGLPYCEDHAKACYNPEATAAKSTVQWNFGFLSGKGSRKQKTPATAQPGSNSDKAMEPAE